MLGLLDLPHLVLDTLLHFVPQLVERLLVCLERLLLSYEIEVLCRGAAHQLLIYLGKLVFKLQLQSLHHLLHFRDLCLAVQNRLDLSPTWLLVKCGHRVLLIQFSFHPLVELVQSALPLDLRLNPLELLQDSHHLLLLLSLLIF